MGDDISEWIPLRCEIQPFGDTLWIRPVGEIDLYSAHAVEDAVKKAFDARFPQLVIDLRRVTFVDSSGLRVFIEARQEALKREIELRVSPGPPRVQRIFEVT